MNLRNITLVVLLLSMLAAPSMAADNTSEGLLHPGQGRDWLAKQDADTRSDINDLFGFLIVVFVGGAVVYLLRSGAKVMEESGEMGDPTKKSVGATSMLIIIAVVIGVGILYGIIMGFKFY